MLCYTYTIHFAVKFSLCIRHLALNRTRLLLLLTGCPLAHLPVEVPVMAQHIAQHLDPLNCMANSCIQRSKCAVSKALDIGFF